MTAAYVNVNVNSASSLRKEKFLNHAENCQTNVLDHEHCQVKAKFHYASCFEAGRRQVRSWSATSFEPVCDQLRTS